MSYTRADGDDDDEDADGEMDETESGPTTTTAAWCGRRWEAQLADPLLLTVNTDPVNQYSAIQFSQYSTDVTQQNCVNTDPVQPVMCSCSIINTVQLLEPN